MSYRQICKPTSFEWSSHMVLPVRNPPSLPSPRPDLWWAGSLWDKTSRSSSLESLPSIPPVSRGNVKYWLFWFVRAVGNPGSFVSSGSVHFNASFYCPGLSKVSFNMVSLPSPSLNYSHFWWIHVTRDLSDCHDKTRPTSLHLPKTNLNLSGWASLLFSHVHTVVNLTLITSCLLSFLAHPHFFHVILTQPSVLVQLSPKIF